MASLKEIRTRIASIKSTRQITSAMKMVAASRLRKVQNNIIHLREYAKMLNYVLSDVMLRLPPSYNNILLKPRDDNSKVLLVTLGSDKGLCGTYNALLIKRTLQELNALENQGGKVKLMAVGKKPERFFKKRGFDMVPSSGENLDKVSHESACVFAKHVTGLYMKENVGRVLVVYNRFRNAVVHDLTVEQLLPIPEESMIANFALDDEIPDERIILEPVPEEVIDYMTMQYLNYNTYRILLDAAASEHGSRMTAMHQATDNADEMLKTLSLSYNKARQASVTRELLDIVGGAEGRGN